MKKFVAVLLISFVLIFAGIGITMVEFNVFGGNSKSYSDLGYKTEMLTEHYKLDEQLISLQVSVNEPIENNDFEFVIDDDQKVGTISIEYEYYPDFANCYVYSDNMHVVDVTSKKGHSAYRDGQNHGYYEDEENAYMGLTCSLDGQSQLTTIETIFKHKQIPKLLKHVKVSVNPIDENKISMFY